MRSIVLRVLIWVSLIAGLFPTPAHAQSADNPLPSGFFLVTSAPGVVLYQKNYQGGSPDYVQVINLSQGARLALLHGELRENRPGKGSYGGDDPRIMSRNLPAFWEQLTATDQNAFCVTNGQFFYMKESPTRLPFPLKASGNVVSDGYALNEFPDKKLILELWPDRANITSLTQESLYSSSAPDIVAGLTETASKRIDHYVGRTFIGVDDRDSDGSAETVLIFNSQLSRQKDAAQVLGDFGADKVMMLDGGGSTQLLCQGKSYISSDRYIPQAIGVIAASDDPPASTQHTFPDPAAGEDFSDSGTTETNNTAAPVESIEPKAPELDPPVQESVQSGPAQGVPIQFSDVLVVPLVMSPVFAILLFFVGRLRIRELS